MAPVSLPSCPEAGDVKPLDTEVATNSLAKKRASVHITEGSTSAKRMSLFLNNVRCRSFSESWAFLSDSTVASANGGGHAGNIRSDATIEITMDDDSQSSDLPDHELLKSLVSFLNDEADDEDATSSCKGNLFSRAATPTDDNADILDECDLVVCVRDFAYPKTHPFHVGHYPPEPEYEESDIEEDDYPPQNDYSPQDEYEDQPSSSQDDRTQGHARGLYDFDAESSSELSFKEGNFLWIHCRQFPGWFLGEMGGVQGLVPENYVQMV
ncbi:hypothetical protein BGX28_007387 [Mortierella sp. GBA30]|nr:hypothetical protein BGX28_007387 [Mortierella sp. GBA30]